MKIGRKAFVCLVLAFLILLTLSAGLAESLLPYADSVFDSATVSLKSTKKVKYDCATYGTKEVLSVVACWLEEQESDGTWSEVCNLSCPSAGSNTFSYTREMDYSSIIGSGTFRIGATFNADGYRITRYSNSRTF